MVSIQEIDERLEEMETAESCRGWGIGAAMVFERTVTFRYNDDPSLDETFHDEDRSVGVPLPNDVVQRNGGQWKVRKVQEHLPGGGGMPSFVVLLTDKM